MLCTSYPNYLLYVQASEELDENQARQLSFDLESAYNEFNKILHSSWFFLSLILVLINYLIIDQSVIEEIFVNWSILNELINPWLIDQSLSNRSKP